jgi:uncharacterized protein (TIGR00251 family)
VSYKNGVLITIYVKPKSREERLEFNEELIYLTPEKPVENRVNQALIKFLSRRLKVSSSKIHIIRGMKSREKRLYIEDLTPNQFIDALRH